MARVLIVGCGCRGQSLARELVAIGHTVRGTTRDPERQRQIEASGAQPFIADPDRISTLTPALDGVTIMCLLLGSATGTPSQLKALHTTRLEMLLQRTIDTTVHGLVYEATGSTDPDILATGANLVQAKCTHSGIPYAILRARHESWLPTALTTVEGLLTAR
jgi:uncharacterized protein YbjT (DUF2867 family)